MKFQIIISAVLVTCLLTGCGQAVEQTSVSTEASETQIVLESAVSETFMTSGTVQTGKTTSKQTETQTTASFETTAVQTEAETHVSTSAGSTSASGTWAASGTSVTASSVSAKATAAADSRTADAPIHDDESQDSPVYDNYQYDNSGRNSSTKKTTKAPVTATAVSGTSAASVTTTTETFPETELLIQESSAETPAPETAPETQPETEPLPKTGSVQEIMNMMTLEEKIYQMFIVTPEVLTGVGNVVSAGETTQNAVRTQPVAGLIYFSGNLVSGSQTSTMLSNTQDYARESGIGMFLAVDEEGGLVARCAYKLGTTPLSPMATYGARNDRNEAFEIGQILGSEIGQFGFNLDFAPVADVNLNSGNELGTRIFSSDPEVVGNMVSGVVEGLQSTGVAATLKHFPGLGAENGNAHTDDKIIIDRTLDELRNEEFVPFRYGIEAGADFIMVSHQIITGAGDNLPACLSHVICTDLLRDELGFQGVLVTDAFNMNTISGSYSPGDSAVLAIQAGVDIILMPTDLTASVQAVQTAVGSGLISESRINQSVERILLEKEKLNLLG